MKKHTLFLSLAVTAAMVLTSPLIASAHERHVYQIGDKVYSVEIGFLNEPTRVDDKSGIDFHITYGTGAMGEDEDTGGPAAKPAEGLEKTLKVELSAGSEKKTLDLRPTYGNPGAYQAIFYPSLQTTYGFRIFGTIDNVPVDLMFSCNPTGQAPADNTNSVQISENVMQKFSAGQYGCPGSRIEVTFPAQKVSVAELDQKVQSVESGVTEARSVASGAGTMGTIGIVLGLLGLAAGVGAWMRHLKM